MSNPGYVRRLTDLPKPYHTAAMAEVANQTDRGAAIVGAAYVELVLREAIIAQIPDLPDVIMKLLFDSRGPLRGFGACIQVAFDLGIYGRRAYEDLTIIKDVRNAFAHSAEAMDFDHSCVAERCNGLWFAQKILYDKRPKPSTTKDLFVRTIALLTDLLYENLSRQKVGLPLSKSLMMGPSLSAKQPRKAKSIITSPPRDRRPPTVP